MMSRTRKRRQLKTLWCRLCGQRLPRHLVNGRFHVCVECEEPVSTETRGGGPLNVPAMKSAHRRGEHVPGGVM